MLSPTTRGVKVQKRKVKTSSPNDTQRIARNVIRKRKQDLLKRINYSSVMSAVVLPLAALLYIARYNIGLIPDNTKTLMFCVAYYNFTMLAFTSGYHKCYAHSTFRPKFFLMHLYFGIFGASLGVGSARIWAAMHRAHHQFTDDPEKDPYSIKRGFLWAHWGWLLKKPKTSEFYRDFVELEFPSLQEVGSVHHNSSVVQQGTPELVMGLNNSDDAATQAQIDKISREQDTLVWILWQEPRYILFFITTSLLVPMLVTKYICQDSWVNGLIYPGILRMFMCQQLVFSTESVCHARGLKFTVPSQPFNDNNSLVNCSNILISLLTYGQALQNYHHEFPHDYRVSHLVWAFDPTKWLIFILAQLGLVEDVAKAPQNLVIQLEIQQQQKVLNRIKSQLDWGTPISKLPLISAKDFRRLCDSSSSKDRIYIVVQNIIHDITPFMDQHPGGLSLLKASHGKDATKAFFGGVYGHLTAAVNLLATMRIGVLSLGNNEEVWSRAVKEENEGRDGHDELSGRYQSAEAA